jgi:hypothetical protein
VLRAGKVFADPVALSINPLSTRPKLLPGTERIGFMRLVDFKAKTPLIGMSMVFLAMLIVAVTAYLHAGWYSIIGYVIAAAVAVFGFLFTFRDMPAPPHGGGDDETRRG